MTRDPTDRDVRGSLQQRLVEALARHRQGDVATAGAVYRQILREDPRCFDALHLLGILNTDSGEVEEGIELIRRALAVDSSGAAAHYSLAVALSKTKDDPATLVSVEQALARQPDLPDAWFLRGSVLHRSGRLEESIQSYLHAVTLRAAFPEALNNLADAQRALRQLEAALQSVDRALALRPAYAKALNNRGLILLDCGCGAEAVASFRQALDVDRHFPEAWHNLGTALLQMRRYTEALDAFGQLRAMAPRFPHAAGNLLLAKLHLCNWTDFAADVASLVQAVERGEHAAAPLLLLSVCGSAALQLRCAQLYTEVYFPPRAARAPPSRRVRDKIRVAYLSGDFGEHAVTYLLAGVFERHDPAQFEVSALSWDRRDDVPARRRVAAAFARFIDVTDESDADVVRQIRELDVDIAVDLGGHTLRQRTGILAHRAAPLQVSYLGTPATMGAPYIDYLVADRYLVPERDLAHYSERIVWLPECFQPNDDRRALRPDPRPRNAHDLPEDAFVFCAFNRNLKMNPDCFEVWMGILRAVPHSVLWLLATDDQAADNLRREAERRGIPSSRLVFARETPYENYLARYAHADLFLDTLPFNGGTTVSDALSMGLPVLTCVGNCFAGRMAGSLLTSLGLFDLVAESWDEYTARAVALATDPDRARKLRQALREHSTTHSLFDTTRYTRHLETAYRMIWERYAAGLPPAMLVIPAEAQSVTSGFPSDAKSGNRGLTN